MERIKTMKMIGLMVLAVGFIPTLATATTTDGYLTVFDYFSVFVGFTGGVMIAELKYDNN